MAHRRENRDKKLAGRHVVINRKYLRHRIYLLSFKSIEVPALAGHDSCGGPANLNFDCQE